MSEFTTNEDNRTSSVELKQSAKGDWYVGTLKIYFDKDAEDDTAIATRLLSLKQKVEREVLQR